MVAWSFVGEAVVEAVDALMASPAQAPLLAWPRGEHRAQASYPQAPPYQQD